MVKGYSEEQLHSISNDNYSKLVWCCKKLEDKGFWEKAGEITKQTCLETLDVYVQSSLVALADSCGEILEKEKSFLLGLTDNNPLEISMDSELSEEMFLYAKRVANLPPILIQLCGLYDNNEDSDMTKYFLDSYINILMCMSYLNRDNSEVINNRIEMYLDKLESFVWMGNSDEGTYKTYVQMKLNSASIKPAVKVLVSGSDYELYNSLSSEIGAYSQSDENLIKAEGYRDKADNFEKAEDYRDKALSTAKKTEDAKDALIQDEEAFKGDSLSQDEGALKGVSEKKLINLKNHKTYGIWDRKQRELQEKENQEKALNAEDNGDTEEEKGVTDAEIEFMKVKKRLMERERQERKAIDENVQEVLTELNSMVGLETVKEEVNSLINLIKIRNLREKMGMPLVDMSYHMVFTGAPGTGKTTVARIVSKVYKELGILSKGTLVETDRSGLVAGYVGQTAINVKKTVESALGGVLFIDEAYALGSRNSINDFGGEAIDTLVKMMEDHRNDLVVIVAGYTREMEAFLKSNTGLKSRFNKFIEFDDYSREELYEIMINMAQKAGYEFDFRAKDVLKGTIDSLSDDRLKEFGNARGIRNEFEKIIVRQANRLILKDMPDKKDMLTITCEDVI